MLTTIQLIELAKQRLSVRHSIPLPMTDYRLGKLLDLNQPTVSRWRTGKSLIDISAAPVFADACELPLEFVLVSLQHERAADERVKKALERIGEAFYKGAAAALAGVILSAGTGANSAGNTANSGSADLSPILLMRTRKVRKNKPQTRVPTGKRHRMSALHGHEART